MCLDNAKKKAQQTWPQSCIFLFLWEWLWAHLKTTWNSQFYSDKNCWMESLQDSCQSSQEGHSSIFSQRSNHLMFREINNKRRATSCDLQTSESTLNVYAQDSIIRKGWTGMAFMKGCLEKKNILFKNKYNKFGENQKHCISMNTFKHFWSCMSSSLRWVEIGSCSRTMIPRRSANRHVNG